MFFKFKNKTKKIKGGFTLVELLVVFFIMGTILAVIVPDYLTHSTQLELENLALDIALVLREAQGYGSGAKVSSGGTDFDVSFGVHFTKGENTFIFFENTTDGTNNEDVYNPPGGGYTPDTVVSTYTMKNGYTIDEICLQSMGCDIIVADYVFKRPNPDASIKGGELGDVDIVNGSPYVSGYGGSTATGDIKIISPDQKIIMVRIQDTGNIAVIDCAKYPALC